MIPVELTLRTMQNSFREVRQQLDALTRGNIDMRQRRVINAGIPVQPFDYARKHDLDEAIAALNAEQAKRVNGLLNAAKFIRHGAFATRGAPVAHANELFYASDMDYIGWYSTGAAWVYVSGTRRVAQADIATFVAFLGTNDAGLTINVHDFTHMLRWTGSATEFAPGDPGSGQIAFFPITPEGGTWGVCDGSTYSYLLADGTTDDFVTPNYSTAAYIKAGTSATIGPTAASGTTAEESAHTHAVDPPDTTSGAPSATTEVEAGTGATVASSAHTHNTDIGSFSSGAGSAHSHGPGTLELRRSQLIGYFRR